MDELDQRRGFYVGRVPGASRAGNEHDKEGPQALAAAADDVVPHLVDQGDVARQLAADLGIYRSQVVGDKGPYVFELHGIPASQRVWDILAAIGFQRKARSALPV